MSLTEQQEQQLLALAGRVSDNELLKAGKPELNALESLLKSWVRLLVPVSSRKQTLDADKFLGNSDPVLNVIDCNGGERTVRMPDASNGGKFYIIINSST